MRRVSESGTRRSHHLWLNIKWYFLNKHFREERAEKVEKQGEDPNSCEYHNELCVCPNVHLVPFFNTGNLEVQRLRGVADFSVHPKSVPPSAKLTVIFAQRHLWRGAPKLCC